MAVAIDASSPVRATASTAVTAITSALFDPPACVLVAALVADSNAASSWTLSNNGTALTWTELVLRNSGDAGGNAGAAGLYYAVLTASRTGMDVTATFSQSQEQSLAVYVVTGASTTQPGGSSEGSATGTASVTTTSFNAAGASSVGFVVCADNNVTGVPTSSDTTFTGASVANQFSGGSGYKVLGSAGSSATFTFTFPSSGTLINWVSGEILADTPSVAPPDPPMNRARLTRASCW